VRGGRQSQRTAEEEAIMNGRPNHRAFTRLALPLALIAAALVVAACSSPSGESTVSSGGTGTVVSPGVPQTADGSKTGATGSGAAGDLSAPSSTSRESAATPSAVSSQQLVVVNKTMLIETSKVDDAIAKIRDLVARDGAEISAMQVATAVDEPIYRNPVPMADGSTPQASAGPLRAYVTVRVPSNRYASFVADAAKLGTVLTESETSDDVTQQHVDMQARLGNLQAEQTRLRQLFAKATTVKNMLAVEQELTRVQGDIESMKAQITYLERQAAMATVTLELTEPKAIVRPAGTDWGVTTALTDSIRAFVNTMNALILLLGPLVALLVFVGLPGALIAWLVTRIVRRRRVRRAVQNLPADTDGASGS
jgi:hypothetical protein